MDQRKSLIIWLAMLWAIVMYYVVMRIVKPTAPNGDVSQANLMLIASLALVGLSILVKSRLVPRNRGMGLLVAAVFCDAAALMGLVAWFVTGQSRSFYCLIIGVLGMLLHYPGRDR